MRHMSAEWLNRLLNFECVPTENGLLLTASFYSTKFSFSKFIDRFYTHRSIQNRNSDADYIGDLIVLQQSKIN